MPRVGPLTALAVEAFAPAIQSFRCGRDFAAWLGLVPRQFFAGGKERLGQVTKAGQADIRSLLIIGAMVRLSWAGQKPPVHGSWLSRILAKKPRMLVAIALANKMARKIWAMLTKQEDYRDPALAMTAGQETAADSRDSQRGVRSRRPEWAHDRMDRERENQFGILSLEARDKDLDPLRRSHTGPRPLQAPQRKA
jgi:hypothetical protein